MPRGAGRDRDGGREWVRGFLAIAGLSSLALAQPIYDLLRRTPEFFAIRELAVSDVAVLACLLAVGPALILSTPAAAARLFRPSLVPALAGAPVGLLMAVIVLQAVRGLQPAVAVGMAVVAAVAASWLWFRYRNVRSLALLLSVTTVLAPALLVLDRDVRRALYRESPGLPMQGEGAQAPIVLVVFDEWSVTSILGPDGEIDRRRLPNLARLAERATWYPDALAPSNATHHALPAILTGEMPDRDQLPIGADHPVNLFTLLAPSHDIYAMEPVTTLCPPNLNRLTAVAARPSFAERFKLLASDLAFVWLHLTAPERWAEGLPPVTRAWSGFAWRDGETAGASGDLDLARAHPHRRNDERVNDFRRFIDAIGPPEARPPLYFAHVLLPHAPWEYFPSGRQYGRSREYGLRDGIWTGDARVVRNHQKRYLMQVQFVDRLIGEMLDRLEDVGLFDSSLIAVTSDHGLSFVPGAPLRLPVPEPPDHAWDLAAVPLLVKAPFQQQRSVDRGQALLVDLLPRVLDLAGADAWQPPRHRAANREPLWFSPHQDEIRLPLDRDGWQRARLLEQTELLGGSSDALSIGVLPGLHRRRRDEFRIEDGQVRARFDTAHDWRNVDLDAARLPAVLRATFVDPDAAVDRVVVATLNGVVGDTTHPYRDRDGRLRISATLPDHLLRPGNNRVQLFLASSREESLFLERIAPPRVHTYRPEREHRYEVVRDGAGLIRGLERRRRGSAGRPERLPITADSHELIGYLNVRPPAASSGNGEPRRFRLSGRVYDADNPGRRNTIVALPAGRTPAAFSGAGERDYGFRLEVQADPKQVKREGFVAWAVDHQGNATRLRPTYGSLERGPEGGEVLPVSDGRRLPVVQTGERFRGAVDSVFPAGGGTRIKGWAADLERREPAHEFVLYRDGRFRTILEPAGQERTDVAERFGVPRLGQAGFLGADPGGPLPSTFAERHRVFALMAAGVAVELPVLAGP